MINCSCKEYIPNVFTPNGDHLNDRFLPHINCQNQSLSNYRFSVFNPWGTKIFFTASSSQSWDGTYRNTTVPNGDYVYLIEYETGPAKEKKTLKGRVLVLR
jgi:trimeric autotransporter adhesin